MAENRLLSHVNVESKNQNGLVVWLTGLSGAGKTTIAKEVEKVLSTKNILLYVLDGDELRNGLNCDLSYSIDDRNENVRRIVEVAYLFKSAGFVVIVSSISPIKKLREFARERVGRDHFIEVFVHTELSECIRRDPKGLYMRALSGEIKDFTGINSPYEEPESPDLIINTAIQSAQNSAILLKNYILSKLKKTEYKGD